MLSAISHQILQPVLSANDKDDVIELSELSEEIDFENEEDFDSKEFQIHIEYSEFESRTHQAFYSTSSQPFLRSTHKKIPVPPPELT